MTQPSQPPSETPRQEPEIIPPRPVDGAFVRERQPEFQGSSVHHVHVARLGPLGLVVLALIAAIVTAVILIVLLGALLIWIPVVALLVAVGVFSFRLRR